jgi:RNA polymerase sigma factor (sigma-70 family)
MTHCRTRAEDLAQLTWLKLLTALRERSLCPGDESGLRAYLYTIARNTFIDEHTRKHESIRAQSVDPADLELLTHREALHVSTPDERLERAQTAEIVQRVVHSLPAEQRNVIEMWCVETSIKTIAIRTSAPSDTVLSRKKYAMARMRGQLAHLALA